MHQILQDNIKMLFVAATLILSTLLLNSVAFGQEAEGVTVEYRNDCTQQDLGDFLRGDQPRERAPRKTMLLVMPNISSNPANGLLYGIAGSTGFYLGSKESTHVSAIGFNVAYTTKNQFLSFAKSNIYTRGDRFFLQGDWRYYIYNAPTWGLGTNAPDSIEVSDNLNWQGAGLGETEDGFPMSFNYLKFHEILNYKVAESKYIGIGYHLDWYNKIEDEKLQLETEPYELTPHYIYSELYGFDETEYILSGVSLNLVYDSRDNLMNPYKGSYVNINCRVNPGFLGSSSNSTTLWLEYRTFLPLSTKTPRHLLGFWFLSNFMVSGRLPYMTLMALGEDQRSRSGRGYIAGRFRGENLMYGEAEYRFPILSCSKTLGGVIFVNATTASNNSRGVSLFDYVKPGAGVGLRLMLNKHFRTNITIDFAIGAKSKGFYLSGTETF